MSASDLHLLRNIVSIVLQLIHDDNYQCYLKLIAHIHRWDRKSIGVLFRVTHDFDGMAFFTFISDFRRFSFRFVSCWPFFTAFCIFIEVLKRTQNMQCDTIQAVDFNARHMQIRSEIDSFIEQGERERVKEAYQILWFLYGLWLHHFYQSTKSNALNKIFGIFNT